MATNVTYTTLIQDLQNYLERGGSSVTDQTVYNQLPRLLNAAERKLAQDLKLLGQIEPLVSTFQAGVPVIQKPDRWRQTVSFNFGSGAQMNSRTPIYPRSYEYCRAYWPDDTQTSAPKFYADYGYSNWLISPTPDQNYPFEVQAYMQPQLLDANNQNNFWTVYCPNALLYGALLEATPFLKNDERIPVWQQMWAGELQALMQQDLQRILDRSAQRKSV